MTRRESQNPVDPPRLRADAVHGHAQSDVTGLTDALNGKANASHTHAQADVTGLVDALAGKQNTLVSGTNIKTVNGSSLLGAGDLTVSGGSGPLVRYTTSTLSRTNDTSDQDWFNSPAGLAMEANSVYIIEGLLMVSKGGTTAAVGVRLNAPAGASARWGSLGTNVIDNSTSTAFAGRRNTALNARPSNPSVVSSTTGGVYIRVTGMIWTGGTAGDLTPQLWQSANSGSLSVVAGTYLTLTKVG
jgi:hypothetical protein